MQSTIENQKVYGRKYSGINKWSQEKRREIRAIGEKKNR